MNITKTMTDLSLTNLIKRLEGMFVTTQDPEEAQRLLNEQKELYEKLGRLRAAELRALKLEEVL